MQADCGGQSERDPTDVADVEREPADRDQHGQCRAEPVLHAVCDRRTGQTGRADDRPDICLCDDVGERDEQNDIEKRQQSLRRKAGCLDQKSRSHGGRRQQKCRAERAGTRR